MPRASDLARRVPSMARLHRGKGEQFTWPDGTVKNIPPFMRRNELEDFEGELEAGSASYFRTKKCDLSGCEKEIHNSRLTCSEEHYNELLRLREEERKRAELEAKKQAKKKGKKR